MVPCTLPRSIRPEWTFSNRFSRNGDRPFFILRSTYTSIRAKYLENDDRRTRTFSSVLMPRSILLLSRCRAKNMSHIRPCFGVKSEPIRSCMCVSLKKLNPLCCYFLRRTRLAAFLAGTGAFKSSYARFTADYKCQNRVILDETSIYVQFVSNTFNSKTSR